MRAPRNEHDALHAHVDALEALAVALSADLDATHGGFAWWQAYGTCHAASLSPITRTALRTASR